MHNDTTPDIASIFRQNFDKLKRKYAYPYHILRAVECICQCRTETLGTHIYQCDSCQNQEETFISCGNRHCPKCQHEKRTKWLETQLDRLLPIEYFHVVFTIPEELNPLLLANQRTMYNILFKAARETLMGLGKDRLGANLGAIAILHTWGQNLSFHPHVHCIVTGGGLSLTSDQWVSNRKGYLLPVEVMSSLFRGKFLAFTKSAHNDLKTTGQKKIVKEQLYDLLKPLYKKDWVVYCKKPFGSSGAVLKYIGNYTHRVAISNHRIEKVDQAGVTFKWRDYKDKSANKLMTLPVEEFIRRFLLHILPPNFVKIRHFGILANAAVKMRVRCLKVFGDWTEPIVKGTNDAGNEENSKCKKCSDGRMYRTFTAYRSRDRPYTRIA